MELMGPLVYLLLLYARFQGIFSVSNQYQKSKSTATNRLDSSVIFPITGNVYPQGYYHVTLNIGQPPKPYFLDIDTGSDLTWLQCDAPCTKCIPSPHAPYKPKKNVVTCKDPICTSLHWPGTQRCESPEEQCDYEVEYADNGSSLGVLVKDLFPLRFTNGSLIGPRLAFGCGYNQEVPNSVQPPYTDGVLGLGAGKSSIVGQLGEMGLTRNVVGHCLSGQGGGFLFFGSDLVPSSGIIWTPMLSTSEEKHYSLGSAVLHFDGQAAGIKGLPIVFDSGSTYTYFNFKAYKGLLSMVLATPNLSLNMANPNPDPVRLDKDLKGKQLQYANDDKNLPVCWKGTKPFKSISDVKNVFRPLILTFTKAKNAQLHLPPESYLIVTDNGNACLGILNGNEVGLENYNIIGDISLQDKMVIYDNEKQQIGWVSSNCNRLPKFRPLL
ncbi:hypothetical protein LguiB_017806 [Lonicera macranthoides]